MLSRREKFNYYLQSTQCPKSVITSDEISEIISIHCGPCPSNKGAHRQRFYRIKNRYSVKDSQPYKYLYEVVANSQILLRVVAKESLFDLLENIHTEGGKHLGRDRLFAVLKQKYSGFSKDLIQVSLNSCNECQLQKCKKQLKSTVTKPIRSSNFASRVQIDLIDFQNTPEINRPCNFLMVYQDHLTKFVILRPLRNKSAVEVTDNLLDIFCLFGPPHILQSDNDREFKNVDLATMIREKWPECKIIHGKARHPQSQGSVERVNTEKLKRYWDLLCAKQMIHVGLSMLTLPNTL